MSWACSLCGGAHISRQVYHCCGCGLKLCSAQVLLGYRRGPTEHYGHGQSSVNGPPICGPVVEITDISANLTRAQA